VPAGAARCGLLERFDRSVACFLSGFKAMLGLGQILLELGAKLLLALERCLRLAAVELCGLPGRALVGKLALGRLALLAGALLGAIRTVNGARGTCALASSSAAQLEAAARRERLEVGVVRLFVGVLRMVGGAEFTGRS